VLGDSDKAQAARARAAAVDAPATR